MNKLIGKTAMLKNNYKIKLVYHASQIGKTNPKILMDYVNELVDEHTYLSLKKHMTLIDAKKRIASNVIAIKEKSAIVIYAIHQNKIVARLNAIRHSGNFDHVASFEMSVKKNYRQLGLATTLIKNCITLIKKDFIGVNTIEINVYENNEIGLKLYDKLGFLEIARIPRSFQWQPPGKELEYKDKVIMHYYL